MDNLLSTVVWTAMPMRTTAIDEPATPEAVTNLILLIFRTNGRLLLAGDDLVSPLGLTSARWQVLGSIAAADEPQPVARLARDIGVSRQAVQRLANDLAREGVVAFHPNPHHKRAQLVMLTNVGRTLFDKALALQIPWVKSLSEGLSATQVVATSVALNQILAHLESRSTADDTAKSGRSESV